MDWPAPLLDSWAGRGGAITALVTGVRLAFWLWRRRRGAEPPLFGWVGRRMALEYTNLAKAIRIEALEAKITALEAALTDADRRESASRGGSDSSFAWPESDLMTSKRKSRKRSRPTGESSDTRQS